MFVSCYFDLSVKGRWSCWQNTW